MKTSSTPKTASQWLFRSMPLRMRGVATTLCTLFIVAIALLGGGIVSRATDGWIVGDKAGQQLQQGVATSGEALNPNIIADDEVPLSAGVSRTTTADMVPLWCGLGSVACVCLVYYAWGLRRVDQSITAMRKTLR